MSPTALCRDILPDESSVQASLRRAEADCLSSFAAGPSHISATTFYSDWARVVSQVDLGQQRGIYSRHTLQLAHEVSVRVALIVQHAQEILQVGEVICKELETETTKILSSAPIMGSFSSKTKKRLDNSSTVGNSASTRESQSYVPLRDWFLNNLHWPYPTPAEREEFVRRHGITLKKVDTFFGNTRRRSGWKPFFDKHAEGSKNRAAELISQIDSLVGQSSRGQSNEPFVDPAAVEALDRVRLHIKGSVGVVRDGLADAIQSELARIEREKGMLIEKGLMQPGDRLPRRIGIVRLSLDEVHSPHQRPFDNVGGRSAPDLLRPVTPSTCATPSLSSSSSSPSSPSNTEEIDTLFEAVDVDIEDLLSGDEGTSCGRTENSRKRKRDCDEGDNVLPCKRQRHPPATADLALSDNTDRHHNLITLPAAAEARDVGLDPSHIVSENISPDIFLADSEDFVVPGAPLPDRGGYSAEPFEQVPSSGLTLGDTLKSLEVQLRAIMSGPAPSLSSDAWDVLADSLEISPRVTAPELFIPLPTGEDLDLLEFDDGSSVEQKSALYQLADSWIREAPDLSSPDTSFGSDDSLDGSFSMDMLMKVCGSIEMEPFSQAFDDRRTGGTGYADAGAWTIPSTPESLVSGGQGCSLQYSSSYPDSTAAPAEESDLDAYFAGLSWLHDEERTASGFPFVAHDIANEEPLPVSSASVCVRSTPELSPSRSFGRVSSSSSFASGDSVLMEVSDLLDSSESIGTAVRLAMQSTVNSTPFTSVTPFTGCPSSVEPAIYCAEASSMPTEASASSRLSIRPRPKQVTEKERLKLVREERAVRAAQGWGRTQRKLLQRKRYESCVSPLAQPYSTGYNAIPASDAPTGNSVRSTARLGVSFSSSAFESVPEPGECAARGSAPAGAASHAPTASRPAWRAPVAPALPQSKVERKVQRSGAHTRVKAQVISTSARRLVEVAGSTLV